MLENAFPKKIKMTSDDQFVIYMTMDGRPDAHGVIQSTLLVGFAEFPDDRVYNFFFHSDDCNIYWDNDRG